MREDRAGGSASRAESIARGRKFAEEFIQQHARVCTGVHTRSACRSREEREVEERVSIEMGDVCIL